MSFSIDINNKIKTFQGDSFQFVVSPDGYDCVSPDSVVFKVYSGNVVYLEKTITSFVDGKAEFIINSAETTAIPIGSQKWSLVWNRLSENEIHTLKPTLAEPQTIPIFEVIRS